MTRGLATVALTGAVLLPVAGLFAVPAYADDASPVSATPTVGIGEPVYVEAPPSSDDFPATGGWIIGGTLQEGSQAAAPPAAPAPVVKPVTVTAPAARPVTVVRPVRPARPTAGDEATVLPFTGPGRLSVQLTLGGGMVLLGVVLTSAARSKGTLRQHG